MEISYKKLWKLLIDLEITNVELRKRTGLSSATFTKLRRNETVSMDVLLKICSILNCDIGDILERANWKKTCIQEGVLNEQV